MRLEDRDTVPGGHGLQYWSALGSDLKVPLGHFPQWRSDTCVFAFVTWCPAGQMVRGEHTLSLVSVFGLDSYWFSKSQTVSGAHVRSLVRVWSRVRYSLS